MIRPKNLQNVLNLRSLIIIRSEVHILKSSDAKDLGYVVRIDGKLFPLTQYFNSTPMYLAFENSSLTYSSIGSSKYLNRLAQSLASKILGIKVVSKVSKFTTCSTIKVASSKMLE